MTEIDRQIQLAGERARNIADHYIHDQLLIADDEGMIDRRSPEQIEKAARLTEAIIDRAILECVGEPIGRENQAHLMTPDVPVQLNL